MPHYLKPLEIPQPYTVHPTHTNTLKLIKDITILQYY